MKWLVTAAAAEEVAMEGAAAVVAEAVADTATQIALPWVGDAGGKPGTLSSERFVPHDSRRV